MATSNPSGDNFFTSRKNLVGTGAAVLIVALHVVLSVVLGTGLGFLWPVVAAAAWGAGVVLTPPEQPKALPPAPREPVTVELRKETKALMQELARGRPPREVMFQAKALEGYLGFIFDEWDDLDSAPEHQLTVSNIVKIYLPEVIRTYLNAPQYQTTEAVEVMNDSLSTLTGAVHRIKQGILDQNLRAMDSQARTLRETFGNLPGLDSGEPGTMGDYDGR